MGKKLQYTHFPEICDSKQSMQQLHNTDMLLSYKCRHMIVGTWHLSTVQGGLKNQGQYV